MNDINEALKTVTHDAILQKIDTIAITYKTKDGSVHSFSYLDKGQSAYALVGMVDDLKEEAYGHFSQEEED